MCVGVIFYFLLSLMFFHLQEKLKKKEKVAPVLSVGKQNCVDKMSVV